MASKNNLLGSGVVEEPEKKAPNQKFDPKFMYHRDCVEGVVVKTASKMKELLKDGWVDHPGKAKRLPGHEHLYNEIHGDDILEVRTVDPPVESERKNLDEQRKNLDKDFATLVEEINKFEHEKEVFKKEKKLFEAVKPKPKKEKEAIKNDSIGFAESVFKED